MRLPENTCPICGAALGAGDAPAVAHVQWHELTGTLTGWARDDALDRMNDAPSWLMGPRTDAGDDAPTQKFPPISETVLRRPPPPAVRELRGAALLRALADEIDRELREDQDDEYATSSSPCDRRPGCFVLAGDRGACPCGSIL